MNADPFIDTNVLVYSVVTTDRRMSRAVEVLADGGCISAQVLNEFANVAARKLRWTWEEIGEASLRFRRLFRIVLPITSETHDSALGIAGRNRMSFYDALIVASALEAGCASLLTEDMEHGRIIGGRLAIRNPFL